MKSENNLGNIIGYKPLTLSRSQENLNSKRRRSSAWRVLSLVYTAKSKLTGDISPPPNHRKLSFSDILRLVHVSPSDIQRRRMVRLLKQKALQTKVSLNISIYIKHPFLLELSLLYKVCFTIAF